MSFIETSAEYFGSSKTTNKLSSIPIICTISPSLSTPLPQIQFAQNEIIRCLYCKSFISLFSSISQDTYSWRCSICTHENKLPFHYFSTPSSNRAELIHCNYEIFADDSYLIRPPMYPSYIFLIDISHSSSSKGFTSIVCDSISSALSNFKYNERTNVSFLLFDNDLHFVKLTGKVEIVTVPSQEPWIPLPNEEIVANFEEYEENVFNAVGEIRKIVGGNCGCIRPALDIAVEVLGVNGGKVCLFSFNWYLEGGHGKSLSLSQNTEFFDSLAEKMLKNNVACDVFVCGVAYVGLVNLLPLCTKTGGSAFYYKESDLYAADQLYWDIAKTLPQPLGWETLLKLRTSRDFRVATIFGHFTYKNDVMVIPALNNQSFTFELVPVHEITSCTFLYLQFSILYTNNEGIRLIRVFNHRVHLTNSVAGILQVINLDCLLNFYIKQAVSIMIKRDMLIAGQKYLKFRYTELKSACEENLGTWPSNLQTFEKKMQNLMHHKLFINTTLPYGQELDFFHFLRSRSETLSISESQIWSSPVLLQDGSISVPLSMTNVHSEKFYLLDDGIEIVIFAGKDYVCEGFGSELEVRQMTEEIVKNLRGSGGMTQTVVVVRPGSNLEKMYLVFRLFWGKLLEDKVNLLPVKQNNRK